MFCLNSSNKVAGTHRDWELLPRHTETNKLTRHTVGPVPSRAQILFCSLAPSVVLRIGVARGSTDVVRPLQYTAMSARQWSGTPHGYASNVNPAQKAFECAVCKQHKPAGTPCVGHCNHNRAPLQTGLQSGTVYLCRRLHRTLHIAAASAARRPARRRLVFRWSPDAYDGAGPAVVEQCRRGWVGSRRIAAGCDRNRVAS